MSCNDGIILPSLLEGNKPRLDVAAQNVVVVW